MGPLPRIKVDRHRKLAVLDYTEPGGPRRQVVYWLDEMGTYAALNKRSTARPEQVQPHPESDEVRRRVRTEFNGHRSGKDVTVRFAEAIHDGRKVRGLWLESRTFDRAVRPAVDNLERSAIGVVRPDRFVATYHSMVPASPGNPPDLTGDPILVTKPCVVDPTPEEEDWIAAEFERGQAGMGADVLYSYAVGPAPTGSGYAYIATCQELPEIEVLGDSQEQVELGIREAAAEEVQRLRREELPVPVPVRGWSGG